MSTLEKAIEIATKAHAGQKDKSGSPNILHPLWMMLKLSTTEELITAVLHDIVEDCDVTLEDLRAHGFSEDIIKAVVSVTNRPNKSYQDFVLRAASNPIGRWVKLADLQDNCDLTRIPNPTKKDYERIEKYKFAIETIQALENNSGK